MEVVRAINEAMHTGKAVWLSYDGGSNPRMPRKVEVLRWVNEPLLFRAICGHSGTEKSWAARKVVEIRHEYWSEKKEDQQAQAASAAAATKSDDVAEQLAESVKGLALTEAETK